MKSVIAELKKLHKKCDWGEGEETVWSWGAALIFPKGQAVQPRQKQKCKDSIFIANLDMPASGAQKHPILKQFQHSLRAR